MVGLTGLEPVTLRLSSACSNQLSYRPKSVSGKDLMRTASHGGGKGTRTPDIQLAKLALYQLSYTPKKSLDGNLMQPCRLSRERIFSDRSVRIHLRRLLFHCDYQ